MRIDVLHNTSTLIILERVRIVSMGDSIKDNLTWTMGLLPKCFRYRHKKNENFKCITFTEKARIGIQISLNFIPYDATDIKGWIKMAWHWASDRPNFQSFQENLSHLYFLLYRLTSVHATFFLCVLLSITILVFCDRQRHSIMQLDVFKFKTAN